MLRRILIALAIAVVGLFAASNAALAAPTPYPAPPAVTVSVNTPVVAPGGTVDFVGSGYLPGELITITVYYRTASGALVAGGTYTVRADANGNFSIPLELTQAGMAVLSAVGQTSGRTGTLDVSVRDGSSSTSGVTTTVPPNETSVPLTITLTTDQNAPTSNEPVNPGNGEGPGNTSNGGAPGNGGNGAGPGNAGNGVGPGDADAGNPGDAGNAGAGGNAVNAPGAADSGVGSGGLASTGVSITGPLTVGALALMVGLALLFFGTRLSIRRKHGASTHR